VRASIASAPSSGLLVAAATGTIGALIYLQKARISPEAAFSVLDWNVMFIVIIGGFGTIEGPTIGVIVFYAMQHYLADFGTWYLILLGALAIATMLFASKICSAALPRCAISRATNAHE
jgi:branched-chain amino acid transport system permease protein